MFLVEHVGTSLLKLSPSGEKLEAVTPTNFSQREFLWCCLTCLPIHSARSGKALVESRKTGPLSDTN